MNVVVVDDDQLVCVALKTILESEESIRVIGTGQNGREAIELYHKLSPDILLMDIRMSVMTGLEASEHILSVDSHAKILFLTTFSDDAYIIKALNIGAKGYLIKQNFESIIPALKAVHMGQSVFGDEIISRIPSLFNTSNPIDFSTFQITDKEEALVKAVAEGLNNKEIANKLYLSEGTVRNSLSNILSKLNLRDRTQLAIFYYKNQ